jgi:catechol 2,3-dioxygenase-like lactoylglutathione lyase family enzyme
MKKRTGDPWMPAPKFAHTLTGLGVNLLVRDVARAVDFARTVLAAIVVYSDPDFAVVTASGSTWMLHADHTYSNHPLAGSLPEVVARGIGAELRLHGRDPDAAEAAARAGGHTVLAGSIDKPHGLREVFILDPDGYCWVPDVPIGAS